jgi:hypothetical protein
METTMSRTLTACLLTVAALVASPVGADVYKFKDEQGNVLYTDKPSTLPAERLNVQSQRTDTVAVQARQQEEMKRMQGASGTGQQQGTGQQAGQQQPAQDSAQDKADRCAKARARYDNYMNSQKLYEQQANGERRYLTDAEIEAARASAKTSMDVLCK